MPDDIILYDGDLGDDPVPSKGGQALPAAPEKLKSPVLRGVRFERPHDIDTLSDFIEQTDYFHVKLLSKCIPHKHAYGHLLFLGTTDAGKTTCINQVLQEMLWHVGSGHGHRVFIWDFKRTARRYLESLPLKCPVYYLDPVDQRSVGIDWAREIDTPLAAMQFAEEVLYPDADPKGHNFAFIENARSTLYQVVRTFQRRAPGRWELADVVEACMTEENLKLVLSESRRGRAMLKTVFGTPGQHSGIFFSLHGFAKTLGPIAAALSRVPAARRICLRDWLKEEGVLVLGHYHRYRKALAPFQRWVFGVVKDALLSGPDIAHDGTERTSFFLDEVRNSPFGSHLNELANAGRSKGACIVAGLGDIAGIQWALGKELASEFLGMFKTKVFLRVDGEAAEWVAKYFGKQLRMIRKFSEAMSLAQAFGISRGYQESVGSSMYSQGWQETMTVTPSSTFSYETVERQVVYEGDFLALTPPREEPGNGLVLRAYMSVQELVWKEVATHLERFALIPKEGVAVTIEADPENFDFDEGWAAEDYERLGLAEGGTAAPDRDAGPGSGSPFEEAFRPRGGEGGDRPTPEADFGEADDAGVFVWHQGVNLIMDDEEELGDQIRHTPI